MQRLNTTASVPFPDTTLFRSMQLRNRYKDLFEKTHNVKLGFMGFFVKACVQALKDIPAVNGEIDGNDIIYKNYYHIDRKSTRLNSSHLGISYAVFCLKKKTK